MIGTALASAAILAACSAHTDDDNAVTTNALGSDACGLHRTLLREALAKGQCRGNSATIICNDGSEGEETDPIHAGMKNFDDRKLEGLGGNGRACADCHNASDSFTLTPAKAQARWDALQACKAVHPDADDPLFRAIDANDFRTNGENASDFTNLLQNGLIRVTMPLPGNLKLIDPATNAPSAQAFADVWRTVPTIRNVKITGPDGQNPWPTLPNRTGGYQVDARFGTLQEQALGALQAHAQISTNPAQSFLDNVATFQNAQFSSELVQQLSAAIDNGVSPLPDADGPLTDLEAAGKVTFNRACAQCHGGPAFTTTMVGLARFQDITSACPRPVDPISPARWQFKPCSASLSANVRTFQITLANGTNIRRTTSDPGRALITGFVAGVAPSLVDDWGKFDVPSVRGISRTAPYFHNNSADTLEEVLNHYDAFFARAKALLPVPPPGGSLSLAISTNGTTHDRAPTPAERDGLLAYLRKL